jgi:Transposase DDE domain group 1
MRLVESPFRTGPRGTFQVKNTASRPKMAVSADGKGRVSQAGGILLTETLRVTGLGRSLSAALERWRAPRAVHDPGKIMACQVLRTWLYAWRVQSLLRESTLCCVTSTRAVRMPAGTAVPWGCSPEALLLDRAGEP